jgi:formylglycine-generating enzyme required for sulfatase activity
MKDLMLKWKLITLLLLITSFSMAQNTPEMILVEGGSYQMGRNYELKSPKGTDIGFDDEVPLHKVTVSGFYIGKTEITVAQYKEFTAANSDGIKMPISPDDIDMEMDIIDPKTKQKRKKTWYDENPDVVKWVWKDDNPIVGITWKEALLYCNWLSEKNNLPKAYGFKNVVIGEGITDEVISLLDASGKETEDITKVKGYRLPTEAEWEFAARGGNLSKGYQYAGSDNPNEVAWTDETTYGKRPMPVASLKPNELGIYDMSGNAWEWCYDNYDADYYKNSKNADNPLGAGRSYYRSIRGGSWYYMSFLARVVVRDGPKYEYTNYNYGFRVVRGK